VRNRTKWPQFWATLYSKREREVARTSAVSQQSC